MFTDNTIAILSDPEFGFSGDNAILTKPFINLEEPEEQKLVRSSNVAETSLTVLVRYSVKLVTIVETGDTEEERIKLYADYLRTFDDPLVETLGLEKSYFYDVIREVEDSDKFQDALKAAQPLISAAGRFMGKNLDDLDDAVEALVVKVDKKIDLEFEDIIRFKNILVSEKSLLTTSLEKLYRISKGDKEAYRDLKESGVIKDKSLLTESFPSYEQIKKIGEHLTERLRGLHRIGEEISPEWEQYKATHKELDLLAKNALQETRNARIVTVVWIRAHQKMASGYVKSAEWFNIKDAPVELINMGLKAK